MARYVQFEGKPYVTLKSVMNAAHLFIEIQTTNWKQTVIRCYQKMKMNFCQNPLVSQNFKCYVRFFIVNFQSWTIKLKKIKHKCLHPNSKSLNHKYMRWQEKKIQILRKFLCLLEIYRLSKMGVTYGMFFRPSAYLLWRDQNCKLSNNELLSFNFM